MLSCALKLVLPASRALIPLPDEMPTGWLSPWTVGILKAGAVFYSFLHAQPSSEAKATLVPQCQGIWPGSFHKHVATCLEMLVHSQIPALVHIRDQQEVTLSRSFILSVDGSDSGQVTLRSHAHLERHTDRELLDGLGRKTGAAALF